MCIRKGWNNPLWQIFDYSSHRNLPREFWGDIDDYLVWPSVPYDTTPNLEPGSQSKVSYATIVGDVRAKRTLPREAEHERRQRRGDRTQEPASTPTFSRDYKVFTDPGAPLATWEDIRMAYLVGKLAGEELFDPSGKRIVAKDQYITEEIVAEAERAGKLVQLIVNMVIPGFGG